MFFFKRKKANAKHLEDYIWVNKAKRYQGLYHECKQLIRSERLVFIVPFFSETLEEIEFIFQHQKENTAVRCKRLDHAISFKEATHQEVYLVTQQWLTHTFLPKADDFLASHISFLFPEHYPVLSREEEIEKAINTPDWTNATYRYFNSLDSHLFQTFGSDRILSVLDKLGMDKNEVISHKMVTKSIQRAQKTLTAKISKEQPADSEKEWFERNMKSSS